MRRWARSLKGHQQSDTLLALRSICLLPWKSKLYVTLRAPTRPMIDGKGPCSLPALNCGHGGLAPFLSEQPRVPHGGYHRHADHTDGLDRAYSGLDHFHETSTPPASSRKPCCLGCENEKAKYTANFWNAFGWDVGDRWWERMLGSRKEGHVMPLVEAGGSL